MIHVRRHDRQLGSGKTVKVREHDRSGDAAESQGITGPSEQEDGWWDRPAQPEDASLGDHPAGTWYFRQGDDLMAVHPDGTVHPVSDDEPEDEPEPSTGQDPPGTWYFRDHGELYAVWPDGTAHPVTDEIRPGSTGPQDVPLTGPSARSQAQDVSFTRETPEGTETLPVDPSVPRCAEDRGAWGGPPREDDQTFTGPVSFGGYASDGDVNVSADEDSWAAPHYGDTFDAPGSAGDGLPPGVSFEGGVTFGPGSVVAFDGAPAAGRNVNYYPAAAPSDPDDDDDSWGE
jgi:hypothetical protein